MEHSTTIECITAAAGDTLTDTLTACSVSNGVRVDSHSQFQVFLDYNPHADNVGSGSIYCVVELVYTHQSADIADVSGGSSSIVWKSYTVEQTLAVAGGVVTSEFYIKQWRVYADDTAAKDRDPTFSVSLGVKRINLLIKEVGMGTKFGKLIAHVGHQCI